MSQPFLFPKYRFALFLGFVRSRWKESSSADLTLPLHSSQFSTQIVDKLVRDHLDTPSGKALTALHHRMGVGSSSAKIAMRCQWRLSCRISAMLSYAEKLLRVSSTRSATNAESGGCRLPDREPARIGNCELKGSTAL